MVLNEGLLKGIQSEHQQQQLCIYHQFKMLGTSEQSVISNQQRIQQLKERIKNADSLHPKSPSNSRNLPQMFSSPTEEPYHQSIKQFSRTSIKNQEGALAIQLKYNQLDDKMNLRLEQEYKVLEGVEMDINMLQEDIRLTKKNLEKTRQSWQQRALNIERQANQEVTEQCEQIKSLKKDLIDSIEKKYKTIKTETMSVLGNHFQSGWEQAKEDICCKIEDLKTKIESEQVAQQQSVSFMVNSFGEQILKLQQMVQKERQDRSQAHQKVMLSLQRMEEDVTIQILQEKKEGSQGISELQNCLEQLCFKIENYLLR